MTWQTIDSRVESIVEGIWADMCERSGFDLNACDDEIQNEIRSAWAEIVKDVLAA